MRRNATPRIRVELGASVPGAALSAALAAVVAACSVLTVDSGVRRPVLLLLVVLTVLALRAPGSLAPGALVLALVAVAAVTGSGVGPRTFALVLGLHLLLVLAGLCAQVRWDTRVELAVVSDALRELVPVQGVAQCLAGAAAVLGGAGSGVGALRWAALAVVLALALLLLPRAWLARREWLSRGAALRRDPAR